MMIRTVAPVSLNLTLGTKTTRLGRCVNFRMDWNCRS